MGRFIGCLSHPWEQEQDCITNIKIFIFADLLTNSILIQVLRLLHCFLSLPVTEFNLCLLLLFLAGHILMNSLVLIFQSTLHSLERLN